MSKAIIILALLFSFTANSQNYVSSDSLVIKGPLKPGEIEWHVYDSTFRLVAKILPGGELIVTDSLQTILTLLTEIKEHMEEIRRLRSVASQLYERFKKELIQSPLKIELHE